MRPINPRKANTYVNKLKKEEEEKRCPKCNDPDYIPITFERKKKMVCLGIKKNGEDCDFEKEINEM